MIADETIVGIAAIAAGMVAWNSAIANELGGGIANGIITVETLVGSGTPTNETIRADTTCSDGMSRTGWPGACYKADSNGTGETGGIWVADATRRDEDDWIARHGTARGVWLSMSWPMKTCAERLRIGFYSTWWRLTYDGDWMQSNDGKCLPLKERPKNWRRQGRLD